MHLQTDLACEISYTNCEMEKVQISEEAEMLYYELIRALEEEETVRFQLNHIEINCNESMARLSSKITTLVKRFEPNCI